MKKYISQFLFSTSLGTDRNLNIAWLFFRIHIGLSIALHAGLPKMQNIMAPGWFSEQVGGLGFSFPSPMFWATLAAWGEAVGGIMIAIGFCTRLASLQLAIQFFVISYLWYSNPEPIHGMYFQQLYFFCYMLVAVAGSGSYALDALIVRKKFKTASILPLKSAVAMLTIFAFAQVTQAQEPSILKEDIKMIQGSWKGTLSYRDFKSGKDVVMPCHMTVKFNEKSNSINMQYEYPDTKGRNNTDKISINKQGTMLNDQKITERLVMPDGTVRITIESKGEDGSTPAVIKQIIILSPTIFSIAKEVQYMTTGEKFQM